MVKGCVATGILWTGALGLSPPLRSHCGDSTVLGDARTVCSPESSAVADGGLLDPFGEGLSMEPDSAGGRRCAPMATDMRHCTRNIACDPARGLNKPRGGGGNGFAR